VLPVPEQVVHVLAIWKPLSMTKVLVPEPPQLVHTDRLAPGFRPLPEQVPQSTIGDKLTFRVVPLQASKKLTPMVASRSAPRSDSENPEPRDRPPPNEPNN
jgi:hypothetical protein